LEALAKLAAVSTIMGQRQSKSRIVTIPPMR